MQILRTGQIHSLHLVHVRYAVDVHGFRQHQGASRRCPFLARYFRGRHVARDCILVRSELSNSEFGLMLRCSMSRWYRKSELVFRLAFYIVMAPLAGAFGGLL